MDPPPSREEPELEPGSRPCPDADEPETSPSERDDPETFLPESSGASPPPPLRQQLMGACRADERLRPLLALNVSCTAADDRFIAHLAQHFEVSEVGMLARCLCVPLVSLRVGKVQRDGALLCPTPIRGKLNLGLLPSSSMCLTFVGDDGYSEQLALLSTGFEFLDVAIEEISADNSGRSFLVRISESKVFYYWCAEKSKEHGIELLAKMKSLLDGRPTLSDLTGISNSRLDAFATHLHAYLLASSIGDVKSLGSLNDFLGLSRPHDQYLQLQSAVSKTSRFRASATNATKPSSVYQASLSPRSGTFKDGVPRASCSRVVGREKLKRRAEWSSPSIAPLDANDVTTNSINSDSTSEKCDADCSRSTVNSVPLDLPLSFPLLPSIYSLGTCPPPEVSLEKQFKPYYCWCPPCPSSLQYTVTPLHLPATSVDPLPLTPLSSLLANEQPPSSAASAKLDTTDLPSLNLPSILHDPLLHLPLPTSPLIPLHGSQVPTFTPLMSDPIVHVPVIDVCSAGQAYLVSCGPSISSAVPLLPSLKPLLPEADSLVERSARETLMRLIASTPPASNPQLVNILPVVVPESISRANNVNQYVNADTKDKGFGTSCVAVFGSGIGGVDLHSQDEVSSEDDSRELFAEYDSASNDCDVHHCQKI
ncbi:hypothetical protein SETIT_J005700v2 [Setaria italica]|uniref:Uncharacterized protein n=1 Tax=Setaria italica TaxID=4555 RepID=K3Z2B9_SETIT|nr:uncharacterized protein LOC101765564 [Setaria italica]RCU61485.1 hypothetical protein SETIT_J005700v2 [Setaria italica]